jgi:uncharacterized membrane protein
MEALAVLLLIALVIAWGWLAWRFAELRESHHELRARLDRAESDLRHLRDQPVLLAGKPALSAGSVDPAYKTAAEAAASRMPPRGEPAPPVMQTVPPGAADASLSVPPPLPPAIVQPAAPPVEVPPAERVTPAAPKPVLPHINWEQFMGVKLFAWIGGFALFLGVTFFVKYAFDNNLIPPEVRVGSGFLAGLGLIVGGILLKRKDYAVTAQTLCATGVVILYSATYACGEKVFHFSFFTQAHTFLLMAFITLAAFMLAVRLEAQVVAVLGMLGGFLTPILLSRGVDNATALFLYIALLDAGLVAVALHRRWPYLVALGALGTMLTQLGWVASFFSETKVETAMTVFLGLDALFLGALVVAQRRRQSDNWFAFAALALPALSLAFLCYLLGFPELGKRVGLIYGFMLGADLCLLAVAGLELRLRSVHLAAGVAVFLLLAIWTFGFLTPTLLNAALGAFLGFAILHTLCPLALQRWRPGATPAWWGHVFPPLALLLVMLPMFKLTELSWFLWPCVLLIDMLAVGLAVLTTSLATVLAVLVLTVLATAAWLLQMPATALQMPEALVIIGGFAVFFFCAGLLSGKKVFGPLSEALGAADTPAWMRNPLGLQASPALARVQIPAVSAMLPFLLLILVVLKLEPANPTPVFGLALVLVIMMLGAARAFAIDGLTVVGLACVLALEHAWHVMPFASKSAPIALGWHLTFYAVFLVFPFVFRQRLEDRVLPWAVAALAGPAHFYLVHDLVKRAWPNDVMGLLPAAFAVASLVAMTILVRQLPETSPKRTSQLAWFGGAALFFITLIFPIQFERQWITLGWALEGAALLWLFTRLPHPGLRLVGAALLGIAFVRLALNPAVLAYQPRAALPIWNWYLYAYGVVSACLFAGAWFLRPPRQRLGFVNASAVLLSLGVVLAFLLLNLEIADYFTPPGQLRLAFEFSGDFGRDMTYTIAWALFALVLLVAGLWKRERLTRLAGLGLLCVTLLKLFFHDLSSLKQLYRIGALIGVALIAILASFLYQRYFARANRVGTS